MATISLKSPSEWWIKNGACNKGAENLVQRSRERSTVANPDGGTGEKDDVENTVGW